MKLNANAIEMILTKRQMSLKELAETSGISYATALRAVKGTADFGYKTVGKICRALNLPPESVVRQANSQ